MPRRLRFATLLGSTKIFADGKLAPVFGLSTAAALALWPVLAAITFSTLGPVVDRPTTALPSGFERAGAFVLVGFLASLGHPRRWVRTFVIILMFVVLLEALQLFTTDRHARFGDAAVKLLGAVTGLHLGRLCTLLLERYRNTKLR